MSKRTQDRQALRADARKPLEDYDTSPYGMSRANRRARLERAAEPDNGRSNRSDAPQQPSESDERRKRRAARIRAAREARAFYRRVREGESA